MCQVVHSLDCFDVRPQLDPAYALPLKNPCDQLCEP